MDKNPEPLGSEIPTRNLSTRPIPVPKPLRVPYLEYMEKKPYDRPGAGG